MNTQKQPLFSITYGLVIYNSGVGDGRIQNNMTNILDPPFRAADDFLTPSRVKWKIFDPPTVNVKRLT